MLTGLSQQLKATIWRGGEGEVEAWGLGSATLSALPVSSALGDVDQLLDAARVGQGLGVLHVLAGDLVQSAADGGHRLVRQQGGVAAGEPVHQVPHGVFPWGGEGTRRGTASR